MSNNKVLIFSGGIPPIHPDMPASGDGIRAWQICQGLKSCGFDTSLSLFQNTYQKYSHLLDPGYGKIAFYPNAGSQLKIIKKVEPDVIVSIHWPNIYFDETDIPLVIDFHGPHLLERHFQKIKSSSVNFDEKIGRLRMGDFFTCAGKYQKYYFVAWLMKAGVLNVASERILADIPVSFDPALPDIDAEKFRKDVNFIYSGFFLPWQNPFKSFGVLADVMDRKNRGTFDIYGGRHPITAMDTGAFDNFILKNKDNRSVRFNGVLSRRDLLEKYKRAHVALDLMSWNMERELAITTRTVEYLWSGLPVIYNNYSELSGYITRYKAGWCLDPENVGELRSVLEQIVDNPEQLYEYSLNAHRLVRENFTWDRTIKPLAEFCRNPHKRDSKADDNDRGDVAVTRNGHRNLVGRALDSYRYNGLKDTLKKSIGYLKGDLK
jgi:glycosyltransferase involved in cell wall biosynthesis